MEHRPEKSAIGQHLQTCHTCDHNFNENQFKILSTGNSDFEIREALLIKSEKTNFNYLSLAFLCWIQTLHNKSV